MKKQRICQALFLLFLTANREPVLIFLTGRKSTPDMALGLVDIQDDSGAGSEGRIDMFKPVCHILVNRALADSKFFCSLTYCGIVIDDVIGDCNRPFFNIIFHECPSEHVFYILLGKEEKYV